MADITFMSGRWLWCGSQIFTMAQWDALCSQAASWKLQGIHPKVADGIEIYYNDTDLQMLKTIAQKHGLKIAPYHYVYGPKFGTTQIAREAQISAQIGSVFGVVIPDMEDEYMSQYDAATIFAKQVRMLYQGLWIPTTYANPVTHPVPLVSLNPYMDAWLPQVYFSVWQGIAQNAIDYVFPQWQSIDQQIRKAGQNGLKPTLPIISTTNNVDPNQIIDFIEKMQLYGYIGFWYDRMYLPYSQAVINTPIPSLEEEPLKIDLTTPGVSTYFAQTLGNNWRCIQTGHTIGGAILDFYTGFGNSGLCGLTYLGLPLSDEQAVTGHSGVVVQQFERACLCYDPSHSVDNPPGSGSVYLMHLNQIPNNTATLATDVTQIVNLTSQLQQAEATVQADLK